MTENPHSWQPRRRLDDGLQLAGIAAIALLATFFMPWYEKNALVGQQFVSDSISAWGAFSWVEAAILLVDFAVLGLLWLRSTDRRAALPFSDGAMIAGAGGWIAVLLIVRVFDRPAVEGAAATIGLQWGLLVAMAAAGGMLASGVASRAAGHHRPEDPAHS